MKTPLLILIVAVIGGTIVPPIASAGTITSNGGTFGYTAAPGEANVVQLEQTTSCETLAAPCLRFSDLAYNPVTVPAACVDTGFSGVLCPLPRAATIDLGDRVDLLSDWDGPSVIHAGAGEDVVRAQGGNDVLYGDDGSDDLVGGTGNDRVNGGPGNDTLESYLAEGEWWAVPVDSAGTDVIRGDAGRDTVSYQARTDALVLSKDGKANDGAPGENDAIADDVEQISGGRGDDAIVGGPGRDILLGLDGADVITGAENQDRVDGGEGEDAVAGGEGSDGVAGGGGDDLVVGGPGADALFGDYHLGCGVRQSCLDGDDEIRADDGTRDLVDCGRGIDAVRVDTIDYRGALSECEGVEAVGSPCAGLPRSVRPVCKLVVRTIDGCTSVRGAKKKRCLARGVKRATKTCRKRFRGRQRASCIRSVRRLVK
jgi:Ca2+-binding RTX toxin-like protein